VNDATVSLFLASAENVSPKPIAVSADDFDYRGRLADGSIAQTIALGGHSLPFYEHSSQISTGYVGDMGVPRDPAPTDFSAWFEAFLDGRWYTFDARHNHPRIGRVVIARALDVAASRFPLRLARQR